MAKKQTLLIEGVGESPLSFETGEVARQSDAAVVASCGGTVIFSSICSSKQPLEGVSFLPLRVDYQEKFSSVGKTAAGFIKRERGLSQREILVSRLIDRPIRPLFPEGYTYDTQILSYVWSHDLKHSSDVLAICSSSLALFLSGIPVSNPIAAVRVGRLNNRWVVNPTVEQQQTSSLDLVIAGTKDSILMIEGYCDFLPEEDLLDSIEVGHEAVKRICQHFENFKNSFPCLSAEKGSSTPTDLTELEHKVRSSFPDLSKVMVKEKQEREIAIDRVHEEALAQFEEEYDPVAIKQAVTSYMSSSFRTQLKQHQTRIDGRQLNEVRHIDIRLGTLPCTHGSALFTRGETQSLCVCTLGGKKMAQKYEDLFAEKEDRFYLQYSFPPFCVGEVGRTGMPSRREIGHGKLAERALLPTLPTEEAFPYVIRLESNITESNGSSSMASLCGGSLALMDAGVPILRPIAGIALGLIADGDDVLILSDINGIEDAFGDMDLKLAGDENGFTAFQMDLKVEGISMETLKKGIERGKEGIAHILNVMRKECSSPKELSDHAPRIARLKIPGEKIGALIGPKGKTIQTLCEETGAEINVDDAGWVSIAAANKDALLLAEEKVRDLTEDLVVGHDYHGKVVSIAPFGVFVEVRGKQGLCHVSEVDSKRIEDPHNLFQQGDPIDVRVLGIDGQGKIRLSRKALLKTK